MTRPRSFLVLLTLMLSLGASACGDDEGIAVVIQDELQNTNQLAISPSGS